MKKIVFTFLVLFLSQLVFSQNFQKQGAGVTVIVHGWNPDDSQPTWMTSIANAMIARSGGDGQIGTITVTGSSGNLTATCTDWNFDLANATSSQIVVLVNWTAVANHLTTFVTAQEVAAAVAPMIYQPQNGQVALAELPLHLIGHSRGGGMVFEIARLLGLQGIEVEHITSLDPHPLTELDPQPVVGSHTIDTPIKIYENVLFVDNYIQYVEYPKGQPISGAFNRLWSSLPGGYHNETGYTYNILGTNYNFSDHLNIILMYHGTCDLTTPVTNGEATMTQTERDSWYNAYENQGEVEGYYYSSEIRGNRKSLDAPVSGGDSIIDGYHNNALLGGNGVRDVQDWTNAVWPNVYTIDILKNSNVLQAGIQTLTLGESIQIRYARNLLGATETYIDIDRNPYNGNDVANIVTKNINLSNYDIEESLIDWVVAGLDVGTKYYIYAKTYDGSYVRYIYSSHEFDIEQATKVDNFSAKGISVYPNPTKGLLNFDVANNDVRKVVIYDITGKILAENTNIQQHETIDISDFKRGIYFIKIQTENEILTTRIIKD